MWREIFVGGALWVSIYATFLLNFCDFTRNSKSRRSIVKGNFWGIPLNVLLFGLIAVVLAGTQFKISGVFIASPGEIVQTIPNTFLLVIAALALLVLTIAVNLIANFVAPIYALTNLFPRKLNFFRAGLLSAVIGLVILPWNLYDNPAVINYFLGGLGGLLGPLFGVIIADYWLIRRTKINVPELYTDNPTGTYFYRGGVNPGAIAAFIPAAGVSLVFAFVPLLHACLGVLLVLRGRSRGGELLRPGRPPSHLRGGLGRGDRRPHRALTRRLRRPHQTLKDQTDAHPRRQREHHPVHDRRHRTPSRRRRGPRHRDRAVDTPFGADSVEGNFESYLAAVAVMDRAVLPRAVRRRHPGRLRRTRP